MENQSTCPISSESTTMMTKNTKDLPDLIAENGAQSTEQKLRDISPSPDFLSAMMTCIHFKDSLSIGHPEFTKALMKVMRLVTDDIMDAFVDIAQKLGLFPEPDGFTEDGEPVFRLEDVAVKVGIPIERLEMSLADYAVECALRGLGPVEIDPARVHLKQ